MTWAERGRRNPGTPSALVIHLLWLNTVSPGKTDKVWAQTLKEARARAKGAIPKPWFPTSCTMKTPAALGTPENLPLPKAPGVWKKQGDVWTPHVKRKHKPEHHITVVDWCAPTPEHHITVVDWCAPTKQEGEGGVKGKEASLPVPKAAPMVFGPK